VRDDEGSDESVDSADSVVKEIAGRWNREAEEARELERERRAQVGWMRAIRTEPRWGLGNPDMEAEREEELARRERRRGERMRAIRTPSPVEVWDPDMTDEQEEELVRVEREEELARLEMVRRGELEWNTWWQEGMELWERQQRRREWMARERRERERREKEREEREREERAREQARRGDLEWDRWMQESREGSKADGGGGEGLGAGTDL
jgi:hypothetical protein